MKLIFGTVYLSNSGGLWALGGRWARHIHFDRLYLTHIKTGKQHDVPLDGLHGNVPGGTLTTRAEREMNWNM